jgi:hypothetical protein
MFGELFQEYSRKVQPEPIDQLIQIYEITTPLDPQEGLIDTVYLRAQL